MSDDHNSCLHCTSHSHHPSATWKPVRYDTKLVDCTTQTMMSFTSIAPLIRGYWMNQLEARHDAYNVMHFNNDIF
jgi:hypothetical protein